MGLLERALSTEKKVSDNSQPASLLKRASYIRNLNREQQDREKKNSPEQSLPPTQEPLTP
ncbi:MAG: hypothetical protein SNJ78_04615 [Spirochaetales bacterium]